MLLTEMERIGVPFKFFTTQEDGSTTKFTKLDGMSPHTYLYNCVVPEVIHTLLFTELVWKKIAIY